MSHHQLRLSAYYRVWRREIGTFFIRRLGGENQPASSSFSSSPNLTGVIAPMYAVDEVPSPPLPSPVPVPVIQKEPSLAHDRGEPPILRYNTRYQ